MDEELPIRVNEYVQRVAHMGSAGNCQTDRNPDGSWPETCTCGECTIEVEP